MRSDVRIASLLLLLTYSTTAWGLTTYETRQEQVREGLLTGSERKKFLWLLATHPKRLLRAHWRRAKQSEAAEGAPFKKGGWLRRLANAWRVACRALRDTSSVCALDQMLLDAEVEGVAVGPFEDYGPRHRRVQPLGPRDFAALQELVGPDERAGLDRSVRQLLNRPTARGISIAAAGRLTAFAVIESARDSMTGQPLVSVSWLGGRSNQALDRLFEEISREVSADDLFGEAEHLVVDLPPIGSDRRYQLANLLRESDFQVGDSVAIRDLRKHADRSPDQLSLGDLPQKSSTPPPPPGAGRRRR